MRFTTIQASAIKSVFEVLKDILNDINIYFTKSGIRILTLDTARSSLVDLKLDAENFEEYECDHDIIAGVNITNTHKLLKTISGNDTLEFIINDNEFMYINIRNTVKGTKTTFKLKLLDVNEDQIELPAIPVNVITIVPSIDFQRICRDMYNLSSELHITKTPKNVIFECEGDFASQKTHVEIESDMKGEITGKYSLKYLNLFTKATSLCSTIQLLHEYDSRFLILKYNVANLGYISFYLATKVDP